MHEERDAELGQDAGRVPTRHDCIDVNAVVIADRDELAAFISPRALVTVRKDNSIDIDAVMARWDSTSDLAKFGVAFLVHGLLDYIVDSHFQSVQQLDEEIENLEDLLFATNADQEDVQRRSFALRKSLVLLRRYVLPMREVLNTLMRRDLHLVEEPMSPYFQDIYDHVLRATDCLLYK